MPLYGRIISRQLGQDARSGGPLFLRVGDAEPIRNSVFWGLLTFSWVGFHDRPGSGGQRPPRRSMAMVIRAVAEW
jgi:hypothetical protein